MRKPTIYEKIPDDFNQLTQYVVQKEPVDMGNHIFYGIEVLEMVDDADEELPS